MFHGVETLTHLCILSAHQTSSLAKTPLVFVVQKLTSIHIIIIFCWEPLSFRRLQLCITVTQRDLSLNISLQNEIRNDNVNTKRDRPLLEAEFN